MLVSSFPPVVSRRANILFTLLCLFTYSAFCVVLCFLFCFSSSFVPYISALSIFYCLFRVKETIAITTESEIRFVTVSNFVFQRFKYNV